MKRRQFVATVAAGAAGASAGCPVGGSEVVTNVQRTVRVEPGQGWIERIADVSDPGGGIQYTAQASQPFDVYFFTSEESYVFYDTYTDGGRPARTPGGAGSISASAERADGDAYRAATGESGARKSIDASGPYFFVVDHSGYRGEHPPGDQPKPLSAFVDLTVTKKQFGL